MFGTKTHTMKLWKWLVSLFVALAMCGCQEKLFISVDVAQFERLLIEEKAQLVDVRTPQEFAEEHIPGALNIDVKSENFTNQCVNLLNKKLPVAVYCRSGRRSKVAAQQLTNLGFLVYDLDKGIIEWRAQEKPLE